MKKIFSLAIMAAMTSMALSSCTNDVDEAFASNGDITDPTKAHALAINDVSTDGFKVVSRAVAEKSAWASGDAIGVSAYTSTDGSAKMKDGSLNMKWAYDSGSWSCTSPLNLFNYDSEGYLTAYYPYSSSITDPTAIPITASADWMYAPITDNRTVSYSSPKNSLTMQHASARITVNLVRDDYSGDGAVTSMTVKCSKFASAAKLNSLTGELSNYTASNTITSTYRGNLPKDKTNATTIDEWFIPIDGSTSDLVFDATIDGVSERYTIPQNFEKGKRYVFTLSITNSGMGIKAENNPIDLGLPSGLKWARGNLGAEKETDSGLYYAWGETTGYVKGSGHNFSSSAYSASSVLENLSDNTDAATVRLGSLWRMPTENEIYELINETTKEWTIINGVKGYKFTSKKDTSKYVFFPAVGAYDETTLYGWGTGASYWSSSFYTSSSAYSMDFYSGDCYTTTTDRYFGQPIRAVCE